VTTSTQTIPEDTHRLQPFFREAGTGPGVVCLHSNASTSRQWRGLMDLLAPEFRVLAPDSYGSGQSPDWPSDRIISLLDEVTLIEPVLARAGSPLALVGHSYGAAIALIAALANPGRVRAVALYEPTLFALLDADTPPPNEAEGIRNAVADASNALDGGNRHALFTEPTPLVAFRSLEVPVLYMVGKRSTPSARGVARLLVSALPRVELVEFEDLGHMGPMTHPDRVNEVIARFLERA
jgi:pimeloyl-ACP methyl ester carboxylesterase